LDLEQELLYDKSVIEDEMRTIFPPIVEERYSDKTGKRLKDKVTIFNPSSRKQIAERLKNKYGWKAPKTDKGNPKVDADVIKKLDYPEAKELVKYFDIIKTMAFLKDWITRAESSRDNKIHSSVNPQGTVTGRMTSNQPNLQQVTADRRIRELFVPREGWVQVGIDASGLEARMLASRMFPWDNGAYGQVVLEGDIHSKNMEATGIEDRAKVKTFFYGFIYGAGDAKIGKIIEQDKTAGKKLKEKFLNNLPALRSLIESCKFQSLKKNTITLLDGREAPCRSEHSSLNVQLQGDGAIVMKLAQCLLSSKIEKVYKGRALFMATVHDEWQLECEPEIAEEIGKLGVDSIREAGERLGCQIPLDGEYKIGKNWWDCH
jgi:DNA polymerase-1